MCERQGRHVEQEHVLHVARETAAWMAAPSLGLVGVHALVGLPPEYLLHFS